MFVYLVFLVFEVIYDFSFTGSSQTKTLEPGFYKFEVWGAQGGGSMPGNSNSGPGSKGGYSVGYITLTETTTVYIQVGGVGKSVSSGRAEGGYNGGGYAWASSWDDPAHGGGGGTDIRINEDNIYARVIVAGGGGAGGEDSEYGGFGGGLTGGGNAHGDYHPGGQTSSSYGGAFFQGAHTRNDGGGGGGGWYGGGTLDGSQSIPTSNSGEDTNGGSGGSGYVYTESTAKSYPSGCKLTSKYYLTNASTIGGNQQITEPDGTISTGHSGNGTARITLVYLGLSYYLFQNEWAVVGFLDNCLSIIEPESTIFEQNVVSIANNAFKDQSCITEVKLPDTIREIGSSAFENCITLVNVSFITSSSLISIGDSAFKGCSKLNSFGDLSKATTIGNYCFQGCTSLNSFGNLSKVTTIGDYCFQGCTSLQSIGDLTNLASIGTFCFQGCTSLNSFGDLSKVSSIGDYCFQGAGTLNQIGDRFLDLQTIGKSAFKSSGIETINLSHCLQLTSFSSDIFRECFNLQSVFLPMYLTSIAPHCFYYCISLKYVDLPFKITSLGEHSFSYCRSLVFVNIPGTVPSINPYTFSNSGIESVRFRATITINGNAFCNCSNLTSVTLFENSVIKPQAFALCPNISKIFLSELVTLHNNSFDNISPSVFYLGLIHVCPEQSKFELRKFNLNSVNVRKRYEYDDYAGIKVYRMEVEDLHCGRFPSLAYSLIESLKKFTSLSAFQVIV
ncbi:surface antigen BspA-like [Trichomonas vaginalis G3]|uniref:receptor protein-tyrosine kinase n=1 Tax=Trichomonas vaginalis (strain ATCC PRA-98 / G3) TaxID=412133 RepID=A2EQK4_TRIV3|nr:protein kinase a regulatory subunit binding [Trichomonas vaginalis G3]EAY05051.1 surface antigen BspA-like [Trichomonas vaginalis G3]KAI5488969.1 protein kinase a regulatory subunit binding [Trichomonas vaginalis G3]|eukprot:XP_001317274.1 surface antigen BspA-like [Trichomonas vaginalis G3]